MRARERGFDAYQTIRAVRTRFPAELATVITGDADIASQAGAARLRPRPNFKLRSLLQVTLPRSDSSGWSLALGLCHLDCEDIGQFGARSHAGFTEDASEMLVPTRPDAEQPIRGIFGS